jgi:hypothetical protein
MVLPLLGSFLGSAVLPGMFTGLSPVAAGALGSGIGSLLQGDDFDEAIKTGLLSFMGGKLLGGLQKVPTTGPVDVSFGEAGNKLLGKPSAVNMSQIGETGLSAPKNPINIMDRLGSADTRKGLMSDVFGQGLATVKANPLASIGVAGGATLGSAMANRDDDDDDDKKSDYKRTETVPVKDDIRFPVIGYRPGIDPEFNYGFTNPSASQLQTKVIQEGGIASLAPTAEPPNEKDLIVNAVNAVKGNMDERSASIALAQFVQKYGQEALEELVTDVREGEYDNIGGKADGMIDGGGDGMSDSVPATIDGQQDLLISKDEYVVDAPTVAMIGNGSSDAGAEKLDKMREEVRKAATGSSMQPEEINAEEIMSKAIS